MAAMVGGNNGSGYASPNPDDEDSSKPMPFDHAVSFQNRVRGDSCSNYLTSRGKTGGLSRSEFDPCAPLQPGNLDAAFSAGDESGAVAFSPNGSLSLSTRVRRDRHNVIPGAHG